MQKKREKKAANDLKEIFVSSGPSDAAGLQELPSFFESNLPRTFNGSKCT